jgi:hypothetical protein
MQSVLTTATAVARFGAAAVRHKIDRRVWQRPVRGVVVLHNGPLTPGERLAVALAAGPPGSALGGVTALELDGLQGFSDAQIQLVVPQASRRPTLPSVVVHFSSELSDADVHPSRTPRRTRPGRSIVDFASWQPGPRRARAAVLAPCQQGVVTTRLIREAVQRRGPCRHRALIVESALDAAGGIQSLPERDFGEIWAATGLPPLSRQARVQRADGAFFLDAYCDRLGFGVEVHGTPHMAVEQWDADLLRANEIVAGGRRLLVFSSYAVRHAPTEVMAQIRDLARTCGATPATDLVTIGSLPPHKRHQIR